MVASEATPFSKTGGLADVATALRKALGRMGHDVTLFTPRYRGAGEGEPRGTVRAYVADHWFDAHAARRAARPGARALLVDCPPLYDRAGLYTENATSTIPTTRCALRFCRSPRSSGRPQQATPPSVFHVHDWQTGLTPVYARRFVATTTRVPVRARRIHNLAYQGIVRQALGAAAWPRLGRLHRHRASSSAISLSFLKAGINFSDALTTVSPTYAEEIQRPEYGYGFDGVIRARRDVLTGILNGIDTDEWNPATRSRTCPRRSRRRSEREGGRQARAARDVRLAGGRSGAAAGR